MLKKTIIALLLVMVLSSLTACNTTRGAGEDVSAGGEAIQRAAQ
ncbi:entericidin A/B family lipoprotein [Candidatus Sodalis endolongispinus]|uniref:Entericidin A/B family lipoprotein n=1 Tax=Candidatus Sodalis endolongispinus TaxID=2812662 RepID=A0ABS5YB82_9GAMM|nr:entericidin A/B family lipoprotein [Candidatus Sodalis endolongispinus]MBT9431805.1 entericidin A/B family lipoprotein [Candidatus Sodalis endolongispinus]